jgi:hypothetical protein
MISKQHEQWRMFYKPDTQPFERLWSDPSHMSPEDVVKGKGEDSCPSPILLSTRFSENYQRLHLAFER